MNFTKAMTAVVFIVIIQLIFLDLVLFRGYRELQNLNNKIQTQSSELSNIKVALNELKEEYKNCCDCKVEKPKPAQAKPKAKPSVKKTTTKEFPATVVESAPPLVSTPEQKKEPEAIVAQNFTPPIFVFAPTINITTSTIPEPKKDTETVKVEIQRIVTPEPEFKIPTVSFTHQPSLLPGSMWHNVSYNPPSEDGNIINTTFVEQGITLFRSKKISVIPYVSVTNTTDTKGYDWNNRVVGQVGMKLVKSFDHGLIQFGGGYSVEERWLTDESAGQLFGSGSYWFGWGQPTEFKSGSFSAFPGSSWGTVGNISPVEKNNVIATARLEQGVVASRIRRASLIPFGEYTFGIDTDKVDWNNKQIYGGGIKITLPVKTGVFELGAKYTQEDRMISNQKFNGFGIFGNIWFGWNPPIGGR